MSFEANQGQTDSQVQYLARGPGYNVFLTSTEAVLTLNPGASGVLSTRSAARSSFDGQAEMAVVRMQLLGGNPGAQPSGVDRLPGVVNYFVGNDPSKWQTRIPTYAQVQYQDVYPGIGLVYYGNKQQLEYDFRIAPEANPQQIRLAFVGAQSVNVDAMGELAVQAGGQVLRQQPPVAYQDVAGVRREVTAGFVVQGLQVSFALGAYDHRLPLVIDPVLAYSTFLGGSGDESGNGIAVDGAGDAFVTGYTQSPNFPTSNPLQPGLRGSSNVFVAKLSPDGSTLVYSTYLGGSSTQFLGDVGNDIAVDASGDAFVTGVTNSPDFPTVNALQARMSGFQNAFVTELTPDSSALVYSTYLGGTGGDSGNGIALDAAGDAFVTGTTGSSDFPTVNPFQPALAGFFATNVFVAELMPGGSALVYSTYLGGGNDTGMGIAVDAAGDAFVTGSTSSRNFPTANALQPALGGAGATNAFVAELTPNGSALVYSTYLGGGTYDIGNAIAVDASGDAFVTGLARSPDFPMLKPLQSALGGFQNAFVAELTLGGSALVYSTFLGGNSTDIGAGIAVDADGNAFVTGATGSLNFPQVSPFQGAYGGGAFDAFVAELLPDGAGLVFSGYLGGSSLDTALGIALDPAGNAYVIGQTISHNFPTVNPVQSAFGGGTYDAFVAKIG
jgi:hypothetical protein